MGDENLAQIRDMELMKLYELSSSGGITKRAKQVLTELERRCYLFDAKRRDFITCEQWNIRHSDAPIDCAEHARKRARR
jgi:hypothetical protein